MITTKLTPFGKQVRHYRIEADTTLGEMASTLGISSSYLSSLEVGRKPLSDLTVRSIVDYFRKKGINADDLVSLADRTRAAIKVDSLDDRSREMVATFARRVPTLSPEQRNLLNNELERFFNKGEK
jgi:DNA-binding XRE family transcriptional regulator